jgi:hypothetical protein
MTLSSVGEPDDPRSVSEIGSMLFTRGVSGTRVVTGRDTKVIEGYTFKGKTKLLGSWVLGLLGSWVLEPLGTWAPEHLRFWALALLGTWAPGYLSPWALASWAPGYLSP